MHFKQDFNYFAEKLLLRLKDYYKDTYSVSITEVMKNNGNIRHSILIRKEDETLTPNIYIDDMYDEYVSGVTFSEITSKIIEIRNSLNTTAIINLDFMDDYELVRRNLGIKLIGKENNDRLLADVPHTDFCDMTIVYYINMENDEIGKGTIMVRNEFMRDWNIPLERLHYDARENMMRNNPPLRLDIVDMLIEMFIEHNNDGTDFAQEEIDDYVNELELTRDRQRHMYVLTNQSKYYGASAIVYPGMLEELGNSFESDYYILPSSIHEVILIPCYEEEHGYELSEMVRSVNETNVGVEEVLSNHAYKYHRENHWLEPIPNLMN
ncbi:MAG: hypothetical protein KBS96_01380 [Lachnospiraceae bacterium]|nr:hypothetical protein [Candidatus Colinaster scatohippi]